MAGITAVCANPEAMRIRVTADLSLAEWKHILAITKDSQYYGPFNDFRIAVRAAIENVQTTVTTEVKS